MPQQQREMTFGEKLNTLIGLLWAIAAPLHSLFVVGTGSRFYGKHMAIGIVLMMVIITLGGGPYSGEIAFGAALLVFAALIDHSQKRKKLEKQGVQIHSRFEGTWRMNRSAATGLILIAGLICSGVFTGLGVYLILASLGLAVSHDAMRMEWDARKRAIRDARIESEVLHEEMEQERR
jgi:hypothetical protein